MDAIPKVDIKSVIKSDISVKPITWIGHKRVILFLFLRKQDKWYLGLAEKEIEQQSESAEFHRWNHSAQCTKCTSYL